MSMTNLATTDDEVKTKAPKVRKHRSSGKQTRTAPTKKAGRYANLVAHAARNPADAQSARHLTHEKWNAYR